ncbi:lectin-like [Elaeis guineensis]|uniref:lectin-like n=1 Tax=Elaeis guineensis var. tenera TaxID=51953 RepID=UPI003C6D5417
MKSSKATKGIVSYADLQPIGDLHDILRNGSFINNKTMRCVKMKASNFSSFMIYPRELKITWGDDPRYWRWPWLEEDLKVEVAELLEVCWLEVHGSFQMNHLDRGHKYDVMFVIMMKDAAGFQDDATLKLELPDGEVQQRKVNLNKLAPKKWVMVKVGDFVAKGLGEIKYSLLDYDDPNWKTGLLIGGALIKHST